MPPRDSRLRWPPDGAVRAITALLRDDYPDDEGRTLVREIVQNADDAEATRLVFAVVGQGAPYACNPLLRGPALLVANDGPFSDQNWDALHQAIGGSKTDDAEKIGRFGLGLKSVFHLCEAFVYLGAERNARKPGVVNPWAGTDGQSIHDPLHPEWDNVVDCDQQLLLRAAGILLGDSFPDGLLLWIPLRLREHCDRAPNGAEDGLGQNYPDIGQIKASFDQSAPLAVLLAQCGHLRSIEATEAENVDQLSSRTRLVSVARPGFSKGSWVGRYLSDPSQQSVPDIRVFCGSITNEEAGWFVTGIDALGLESLRTLAADPQWPRDYDYQGGVRRSVPRKALAHAAVTVLHRKDSGLAGLRIRWAVYLPLDDSPQPGNERNVVETIPDADESDSWEIVMHGYFWPSQNRRSIPGATDRDQGSPGETQWRARWNRTLRDELLLPLLPQALEGATGRVSEAAAWRLIELVKQSRLAKTHCGSVTSSDVLLPVITQLGVRWRTFTEDTCFYALPKWNKAPESVRTAFMRRSGESIFIADDAPRIGGKRSAWPVDQVKLTLGCISCEALGTPEGLDWTKGFVRYVLERDGVERRCSAATACWLAEKVADGALTAAIDGLHVEQRGKLRSAWRRLYDTLPKEWLVDAPLESAAAVVEIAQDGNIIGAGLLPIPMGRRAHADPPAPHSQPDEDLLDAALRRLGNGLNDGDITSQRAYRARLLLAEALIRVRRDDLNFGDLAHLPLLRARRPPNREDEARSLNFLREEAERHRVFAPDGDDSKMAVSFLARALGEPVWVVEGSAASLVEATDATTDGLTRAIVSASTISDECAERLPLLKHLAAAYGARAD